MKQLGKQLTELLSSNIIDFIGVAFATTLLLLILITSCHHIKPQQVNKEQQSDTSSIVITNAIDSQMNSLGLLNIGKLDSTILIHLMYATSNNFTGKQLYGELRTAYLYPNAARALIKAQRMLKEKYPEYQIIVYDAARPMHIQRKMWDVVKGTSKSIYVSNPAHGGGLHNYGLAVDISIVNEHGKPLSMGTEVDHLGFEAHINNEAELICTGKLTRSEQKNRILLRTIMKKAGFRTLPSEWWHFNWCSHNEAKRSYKLIE